MNRSELRGLMQGAIATIPTAFDDKWKLDLGRMADLTRWWVSKGLGTPQAPIKVAAHLGEGYTLSDDEWPHLLRTVVNAAGPNAVVLCGLRCNDTYHTIEHARRAHDLGATGVQIELPIFLENPTQDDYLRHFTTISDSIDIGILIYNDYWFGAEPISVDTMLRMADAEHVVAIKWHVPEGQDYDEMKRLTHLFNVIDNSLQMVRCHKLGGRGYINHTAHVWPPFDVNVWSLLVAGRYEEAQAELDRVYKPLSAFWAKIGRRSSGYWHSKILMAVMGNSVGRPRLPSIIPLTAEEIEELRRIVKGFGWPVAPGPIVV